MSETNKKKLSNWYKITKDRLRHWLGKIINDLSKLAKEDTSPNVRCIDIYELVNDIRIPLVNSNAIANCANGDYLMIINEVVWITDEISGRKEKFAEAALVPQFVRDNPELFNKLF